MENTKKQDLGTFSDPRFVTSTEDLCKILSKCRSCYNLTLDGSLILSIQSLENLKLPASKQSRFFLFVNILTGEKKKSGIGLVFAATLKKVCASLSIPLIVFTNIKTL